LAKISVEPNIWQELAQYDKDVVAGDSDGDHDRAMIPIPQARGGASAGIFPSRDASIAILIVPPATYVLTTVQHRWPTRRVEAETAGTEPPVQGDCEVIDLFEADQTIRTVALYETDMKPLPRTDRLFRRRM
jgi:hypothetical protein